MSKIKRWKVSLPNPDGYDIQPVDTTFHVPQEIVLAADHDAEIERLHQSAETKEALLQEKRAEIERLRETIKMMEHLSTASTSNNAEIPRLREQVAVWLECYKTEKAKRKELIKRVREALGE